MRKLTFTNANSQSVVLGDTNYTIESINGLSTPDLINQEQKAPFQDGTTFIDTLLDVREIVVEGSINAPNNFTAINTAKDSLMRVLSPKLGHGWLQYEATGITAKRIQAIPQIVFDNKHYQEGFQRFQVTFRCNNPYWQSVSASSVNLPTPTTTEVDTGISGNFPSVVQDNTGKYWMAYKATSTGYLWITSSTDLVTWAAPTQITSSIIYDIRLTYRLDNTFLVSYMKPSAGGLVYRTSSDGNTWSGETVVVSGITGGSTSADLIQLSNGTYMAAYQQSPGTGYVYSITSTNLSSWTSAVLIYGASVTGISICEVPSKSRIYVVMKSDTDGIIRYTSNSGTSWVAIANVFGNYIGRMGNLMKTPKNGLFMPFIMTGDYRLACAISPDPLVSNVNGGYSLYIPPLSQTYDAPWIIVNSSGLMVLFYRGTGSNIMNRKQEISATVNAEVTGGCNTPITVQLTGATMNPSVINSVTGDEISFTGLLTGALNDTTVLKTEFGKKSCVVTEGSTTSNGMAYLDFGSIFIELKPGDNFLYWKDEMFRQQAVPTMSWNERYIGV